MYSDETCSECDVIDTLSNNLRQLTSWGCSDIIAFMFGQFPQELKNVLVNRLKNGETILLTAMKKGHQGTLDLLLSDFGADVHQKVVYTHFPSLIQQHVTLLWWAAADERIDVMRALLKHGAGINDTASSGSTPLFAACGKQRSIAIKFLLQRGADPNKADHWGVTCLMKATVSPHLCQLLLEQGSKVNVQDGRGKTALHAAISKRNLGVVEKLIESGADFLGIYDHNGSNALQHASMMRCSETVDYIIDTYADMIPAEEQVQAYRLLAAYLIDEDQNFVKARSYWNKACRLGRNHCVPPMNYTERDQAFPSMRRVCQISDLTLLNSRRIPPQEFAIFLKESILGREHRETLLSIFNRGLLLMQIGMIDQCLAYWIYVLKLQHNQHRKVPDAEVAQPFDCIGCMNSIVDVLFRSCHGLLKRGSRSRATFQMVNDILEVVGEDGVHVARYSRTRPLDKGGDALIAKYLIGVIKLVSAALKMYDTDAELSRLSASVRRIIDLKINNSSGQGLLHLATDRASRAKEGFCVCDVATMTIFLTCGLDINGVDINGNSPLHNCVTSFSFARAGDVTSWMRNTQEIAMVMLEHGAHVDSKNEEGTRCEEILNEMDIGFNSVLFVSLGCLAARVIKHHRLQYQASLPRALCVFVEYH